MLEYIKGFEFALSFTIMFLIGEQAGLRMLPILDLIYDSQMLGHLGMNMCVLIAVFIRYILITGIGGYLLFKLVDLITYLVVSLMSK